MNRTVVAVFNGQDEADQARQELLDAGFSYAGVVVHSGTSSPLEGQSTVQESHGGIAGWFRSLFNINEDDENVRLYAQALRRGQRVLSVHVNDDEEAARAQQILQRHGTVDPDERAAQRLPDEELAVGRSGTDAARLTGAAMPASDAASIPAASPASIGTATSPADTGARSTIPVVQEELQVGKRTVERGGVRVYTRVVETPVEQSVKLREEQVTVERQAVDRPATEADLAAAQSRTVEVRDTTEEAVVAKVARVTEEVAIGRQVSERTETVRDTVRHTDVRVEPLQGGQATARPDAADAAVAGRPGTGTGVDRPGLGDDLERAGNAARRGASRAGDAIERAIPGDSDRDGK